MENKIMFFVFASALHVSGWDFQRYHICHGSIESCLAFYISSNASHHQSAAFDASEAPTG